ncbi:putative SEC14-like protein 2 isoform X2 [Apostichopus japonicus]|uniref:Putative SEC14-like protein 2 isoform X2 n=1 Tax=Stichopus japonicus TaxID=307972 RepID=A0A2G8LFR1_STIJA|nr:putative SEC14-like protein 2 isoform X2 [Apostichopus japonicus]
MSGRVGDLSSEQAEKLAKFRENLKDILLEKHNDHYLLRFLRARNFNLKKSEEMLRKNVEWRIKKDVTFTKDNPLPRSDNQHETFLCAQVFTPFKHGGIIYSLKSSEREKVGIHLIERMYEIAKENSKKQGRYVEGLTLILDMEGLGPHILWKPFINLWNEMMVIMEQYYPETVKRVFVTRPPAIFPLAYSLVKPFLDEGTKKKVKILKSSSNWKETLLKYIDADQLPKHWGGTQVDPDGDPKCPSKLVLGGKVPESYYMKDQLFEEESLTKIVIKPGAVKALKYEVRMPESAVRYVFKTDDGDITFSIYKRNKAGDEKQWLKEEKSYNCHVIPVDGEVEAADLGLYIFCFENTSVMKNKTLSYQIEVLEPDEESIEKAELGDNE